MRFREGGSGSPGNGDVHAPPIASHLRRELSLLPLIAVIFVNVSGGPYGIEDAVPSFGAGLTLVLLLLTPLLWSLPVAAVMAELSSALPEEGGYVLPSPASWPTLPRHCWGVEACR